MLRHQLLHLAIAGVGIFVKELFEVFIVHFSFLAVGTRDSLELQITLQILLTVHTAQLHAVVRRKVIISTLQVEHALLVRLDVLQLLLCQFVQVSRILR